MNKLNLACFAKMSIFMIKIFDKMKFHIKCSGAKFAHVCIFRIFLLYEMRLSILICFEINLGISDF